MDFKDSIVTYLDILGFKKSLENNNDFEKLFEIIKSIRDQNTAASKVSCDENTGQVTISIMPTITSFSDCIVFSIEIEKLLSIKHAVDALCQFTQPLADSLIRAGYLLRGGVARGFLYHQNGVIFGKPLIKAYELESSKAITPRILVESDLAEEYRRCQDGPSSNFLLSTDSDDCNYLNYLKISFLDSPTRELYKTTVQNKIRELKKQLENNIKARAFDLVGENVKVLEKWLYFKEVVDKALTA